MRKILITLLFLICIHTLFGQKNLCGKYHTNFPAEGMFGQIMNLKTDSSFILNYRGDLLNEYYYGKWTTCKRQLLLNIDSTKSLDRRYNGIIIFDIKRGRFYEHKMSKSEYSKSKKDVEKYVKKMGLKYEYPKYSDFTMTPTNYYGGMAAQYFERIK
jgi:hypothetical protein